MKPESPLGRGRAAAKRAFDLIGSVIGLALTWWLLVLAFVIMTVDTGQLGLFTQVRVGKDGKLFRILKIRTMRQIDGVETSVTKASDPRITRLGRVVRSLKIDELPQLINVLIGDMSFVGPRPDVPGFADALEGDERMILAVRPGITGPASLLFRHEEELLAGESDPERYNREVLYPAKVKLNLEYIRNQSFFEDIRYLWATLVGGEVKFSSDSGWRRRSGS